MIIEYINNEDRSSICTVYDATVVPRVGDHVWLSVEWVVRGVVITPNGFMAECLWKRLVTRRSAFVDLTEVSNDG